MPAMCSVSALNDCLASLQRRRALRRASRGTTPRPRRAAPAAGTTLLTRPIASASLRRVLAAEVPDLARLLLADDARQIARCRSPASTLPTRGPVWPKIGGVGGDREVAEHVQHVAAADRVAVHHGDDGLRDVADRRCAAPARRGRCRRRRRSRRRRAPSGRRRCRTPCRRRRSARRRRRRDRARRRGRRRSARRRSAPGTRCAPPAG